MNRSQRRAAQSRRQTGRGAGTRSADVVLVPQDLTGEIVGDADVMHNVGSVVIMLGTRGHLTEQYAREAADSFRQMRARLPKAEIALTVGGYDDDPRELFQVPEVCRFVQFWAGVAGVSGWRIAETIPWHSSDDLALLVRCGVFGDDHPFIICPMRPM
jgi:hypothetical protein